jgi:uncharacterized membrane protein
MDKSKEISNVPEELIEKLPNLPKGTRKQVQTLIAESFSGPIPHPYIIEGYEKVLPGSADRILSMAETQAKHRQDLEILRMKSDIRNERIGMVLSFIMILTVLLVGTILLLNNKQVEGLATLLGGGGILVAINLWSRRRVASETKHPNQQ